ncbi:MAG: SUMF1/EgtB/PvdO family nonheme iron enzyme [Sodaliphilus sp.]
MKKLITLFFALCVGAYTTSATAGGGDVNADGSVNVSDVTALVNQIIGSGSYSAQACDINDDGEVNVSDVTALVNLIINGGGGESEFKNKTFTVNGVSFEMIAVEGGTFTMGATEEQGSDAASDEKPSRQVTLDSFYIGKTEVTQELWEAVMGNNPSNFKGSNLPVEKVTWSACISFISELNILLGNYFQLPTEAQWEYAARGGNKSQGYKYSGSNNIEDVAWYDKNSGETTHPVASKKPNELGLYDMSGNVREWCLDWYSSTYYSDGNNHLNPQGPVTSSTKVIRGGSWCYSANSCRVSMRAYLKPSLNYGFLGLRLVMRRN